MENIKISRQSADQRRGRAGRTQNGECYRMYTLKDYQKMQEFNIPDCQKCNLDSEVLLLAAINIKIQNLKTINVLNIDNVRQAYQRLRQLDAIDNYDKITAKGKIMTILPIDPILSSLICTSRFNKSMITMAAILSNDNFILSDEELVKEKGEEDINIRLMYTHPWSDHWTKYSFYMQFKKCKF